mmetsp:Transcript_6846/g.17239  ORF Transcript_6846/g.17239 Transcript_6846/m.17239 type:complete len:257 (+) Transcript_6846:544-1314(+)
MRLSQHVPHASHSRCAAATSCAAASKSPALHSACARTTCGSATNGFSSLTRAMAAAASAPCSSRTTTASQYRSRASRSACASSTRVPPSKMGGASTTSAQAGRRAARREQNDRCSPGLPLPGHSTPGTPTPSGMEMLWSMPIWCCQSNCWSHRSAMVSFTNRAASSREIPSRPSCGISDMRPSVSKMTFWRLMVQNVCVSSSARAPTRVCTCGRSSTPLNSARLTYELPYAECTSATRARSVGPPHSTTMRATPTR